MRKGPRRTAGGEWNEVDTGFWRGCSMARNRKGFAVRRETVATSAAEEVGQR